MANTLVVKPVIATLFSIRDLGKDIVAQIITSEEPDFSFELQMDGHLARVYPDVEFPVNTLFNLFKHGISKHSLRKIIENNLSGEEQELFGDLVESTSSYEFMVDYDKYTTINFSDVDPFEAPYSDSGFSTVLHLSKLLR